MLMALPKGNGNVDSTERKMFDHRIHLLVKEVIIAPEQDDAIC